MKHRWITVGEEDGVVAEYCELCGLTSEEHDGEDECVGQFCPHGVDVSETDCGVCSQRT